jgi:hypothetical protein
MRHWLPIAPPLITTIALLLVSILVPFAAMRVLVLTTGALVVATVIVAVFTNNTAVVRSLVATLVWSLVLFELVLR